MKTKIRSNKMNTQDAEIEAAANDFEAGDYEALD